MGPVEGRGAPGGRFPAEPGSDECRERLPGGSEGHQRRTRPIFTFFVTLTAAAPVGVKVVARRA